MRKTLTAEDAVLDMKELVFNTLPESDVLFEYDGQPLSCLHRTNGRIWYLHSHEDNRSLRTFSYLAFLVPHIDSVHDMTESRVTIRDAFLAWKDVWLAEWAYGGQLIRVRRVVWDSTTPADNQPHEEYSDGQIIESMDNISVADLPDHGLYWSPGSSIAT